MCNPQKAVGGEERPCPQLTHRDGEEERPLPAAYQMLFRMKNSCMKMQPKGKMPPMMMPGKGFV